MRRIAVFIPSLKNIRGVEISLSRNIRSGELFDGIVTAYSGEDGEARKYYDGIDIRFLERERPSDGIGWIISILLRVCKALMFLLNGMFGHSPWRDAFIGFCISRQYRPLKEKYDEAVSYNGVSGFDLFFAADRVKADKRTVRLCIDFDPNSLSKKYWAKYDSVICLSEAMKRKYLSLNNGSQEVTVKRNSINKNKLVHMAEEFNPYEGEDCFIIETTARLDHQKGIDVAIRAAAMMKKAGFRFKWFVCGEGPWRRKLENMISDLDLKEIFILLGQKDNPYPYSANCDLYVQPSRREGLSNAMREAIILGKYCIATDVSGARDLIVSEEIGIIIPNADPEVLAEAILTWNRKNYDYKNNNSSQCL